MRRAKHRPYKRYPLRVLVTLPGVLGTQLDVQSGIGQLIAIARRGHSITCFVARKNRTKLKLETTPTFRLDAVEIGKETPWIWFIAVQIIILLRIMRKQKPCDRLILDPYFLPFVMPLLLLLRLGDYGPTAFLRVLSPPVETGGYIRSLLLTFAYRLSLEVSKLLCDKVFVVSPMLGESYVDLGIQRQKIAVWPSPVDLKIFKPLSLRRVAKLRRELKINGRLSIIHHGVLTTGRGIIETVEACHLLKRRNLNVKLILLGDGPVKNEIMHMIEVHGLNEYVQICGPVDYVEVSQYIAACDVAIVPLPDHPWWRFQCPIKVLEYLAMKKPLIVSNIPAHRWIIGKAPVAIYLKGTGAADIAQGISDFKVLKRGLRPGIGRKIASRFSVDQIAKRIESEISLDS